MFKVKEIIHRSKGISFMIAEGISVKDFPFIITAKAPPFAFGKAVALVCGNTPEEAKANAEHIFKALKIYDTMLKEVEKSKKERVW